MRCGGRVRVGAVSMQAAYSDVRLSECREHAGAYGGGKDKIWTVVANRLQVSVAKKVQSGWRL